MGAPDCEENGTPPLPTPACLQEPPFSREEECSPIDHWCSSASPTLPAGIQFFPRWLPLLRILEPRFRPWLQSSQWLLVHQTLPPDNWGQRPGSKKEGGHMSLPPSLMPHKLWVSGKCNRKMWWPQLCQIPISQESQPPDFGCIR